MVMLPSSVALLHRLNQVALEKYLNAHSFDSYYIKTKYIQPSIINDHHT